MSRKIISIKEVYKNLKEITKQAKNGQSFLVIKHSKPVFVIEPYEETQNQSEVNKDK